jgi:hypothetical protein
MTGLVGYGTLHSSKLFYRIKMPSRAEHDVRDRFLHSPQSQVKPVNGQRDGHNICSDAVTVFYRSHLNLSLIQMQNILLWEGLEHNSLEYCLANVSANALLVESVIKGNAEGMEFEVTYTIKTNTEWETTLLDIKSRYANQRQHICLESDGKGNWVCNKKPAAQFFGCLDVDISLTPFTNTLPIKRLQLKRGDSSEIKVIYCDILSGNVSSVFQRYTCLSDTLYHYKNLSNAFEATIMIDESDFVVDYPALFVRKPFGG